MVCFHTVICAKSKMVDGRNFMNTVKMKIDDELFSHHLEKKDLCR